MDSKLKVTTAFTGALSVSVKDIVNFGMLTEFAGEIVMESAEALREAGVKVYMDKTDDMTKIKYAVDKDAYAKLGIGDRKAELELKEYYVIVVLDNNKGLVGVKVKCDVKATRNEKEITTTNVRYSWGISRILNQNSVNSEFVKGRPNTSRSSFCLFLF